MHALDTSNAASEAANPPKDRIVSGDPQAVVRLGYASPDGKFSAGTWTCTPGRWRVQYDEVEYCRILSGKGAVIDADGRAHPIKPGDEFVIPAGFVGEWSVEEEMTKTWVIVLP